MPNSLPPPPPPPPYAPVPPPPPPRRRIQWPSLQVAILVAVACAAGVLIVVLLNAVGL